MLNNIFRALIKLRCKPDTTWSCTGRCSFASVQKRNDAIQRDFLRSTLADPCSGFVATRRRPIRRRGSTPRSQWGASCHSVCAWSTAWCSRAHHLTEVVIVTSTRVADARYVMRGSASTCAPFVRRKLTSRAFWLDFSFFSSLHLIIIGQLQFFLTKYWNLKTKIKINKMKKWMQIVNFVFFYVKKMFRNWM